MPSRREALHDPFTLAGWLMRVLGTVVEVAALAVFHAWHTFSLGRSIAREFVGDEHTWHVLASFQKLAKKLCPGGARCRFVAPALDQDIQNVPILVNRSPHLLPLAVDLQKHFVAVPRVAGLCAAAT